MHLHGLQNYIRCNKKGSKTQISPGIMKTYPKSIATDISSSGPSEPGSSSSLQHTVARATVETSSPTHAARSAGRHCVPPPSLIGYPRSGLSPITFDLHKHKTQTHKTHNEDTRRIKPQPSSIKHEKPSLGDNKHARICGHKAGRSFRRGAVYDFFVSNR